MSYLKVSKEGFQTLLKDVITNLGHSGSKNLDNSTFVVGLQLLRMLSYRKDQPSSLEPEILQQRLEIRMLVPKWWWKMN